MKTALAAAVLAVGALAVCGYLVSLRILEGIASLP